jgi:hypothetical protein
MSAITPPTIALKRCCSKYFLAFITYLLSFDYFTSL